MTAQPATYSPDVFNVGSIDHAKRIILTPEGNHSTEERWKKETPYLLSLIEDGMKLTDKTIVLDYGCGIGRMAKALIEKHNCRVVGVDISPSMRALAHSYVASDRFVCCDPAAMYWLGVRFDIALAIWVLQHCHNVADDIARIKWSLFLGGKLFVVNDRRRLVPTKEVRWVNDGQDVNALLGKSFAMNATGELDIEATGDIISAASYWAMFEDKG